MQADSIYAYESEKNDELARISWQDCLACYEKICTALF